MVPDASLHIMDASMRFLSKLFGKGQPVGSKSDLVNPCSPTMAVAALISGLRRLLVEGYERDPNIRARGPLPQNRPEVVEWFCAVQIQIVTDLIQSLRRLKNESALRRAVDDCKQVIIDWGIGHGARADRVCSCEKILHEGLIRFRPIFEFTDAAEINRLKSHFDAWSQNYPELRQNVARISLFLADDAFVREYLRPATDMIRAT
jgi:hypothetical protein